MPHNLFFICPNCFSEETLLPSKCSHCQSEIKITREQIFFNNRRLNSEEYEELLQNKIQIVQSPAELSKQTHLIPDDLKGKPLRISRAALLKQGIKTFRFSGYHHIFYRILQAPAPHQKGHLILTGDMAIFVAKTKIFRWPLAEFTCITTNSHYFEFKIRHQPFFQIHFSGESPYKYEIIFQKWLAAYHRKNGMQISEFQPHIRFRPVRPSCIEHSFSARWPEKISSLEKTIFAGIQWLLRRFFSLWIRVCISGNENWVADGNGFVLANHQSVLDPFIIGAYVDRNIAFLTKSTSFVHAIPRWFLKWAMALPTTRFQTDPEIIRVVQRIAKRGLKVGIFPEGERTWGGRLRPFKLGVVKLLMAARQPITPVILTDTFKFLPRWAKWPAKCNIDISIKPSFCLLPRLYSVEEQRQFLQNYFQTELNSRLKS